MPMVFFVAGYLSLLGLTGATLRVEFCQEFGCSLRSFARSVGPISFHGFRDPAQVGQDGPVVGGVGTLFGLLGDGLDGSSGSFYVCVWGALQVGGLGVFYLLAAGEHPHLVAVSGSCHVETWFISSWYVNQDSALLLVAIWSRPVSFDGETFGFVNGHGVTELQAAPGHVLRAQRGALGEVSVRGFGLPRDPQGTGGLNTFYYPAVAVEYIRALMHPLTPVV